MPAEMTVTSRGRTHHVPFITPSADVIPVPVDRCESGYKPSHEYRVDDAYMYRVGPRRWRLRYTGAHNVDSWTDHATLRDARRQFTLKAQLDLRE